MMQEELKAKSKWSTRRKFIVAFAVLVGTSMITILPGLFWQLHEANSAFRVFSGALITKDYVRAYDFISPEVRATADYKTFVKVQADLTSRLGDLKQIEANQTDVNKQSDGWYGTVDAHLIFTRGSLPFTFVLKKESNVWKIYSYHEK